MRAFLIFVRKKERRERERQFLVSFFFVSLLFGEKKKCVGAVNTGRKREASVFIKNYYCESERGKKENRRESCERSVLSFAQTAEMESVLSY